MFCSSKSAAQRRFVRSSMLSAGLVIVLAVLAAAAFRFWHLKGLAAYPVAALPALPILWVLIETGRYLADEKDEFQQNLLVQCLLGGIGGTLAVTTVWGYMEDFARAPRLDLIWVYPIFWLFVGIAKLVVYRRYR